MDISAEPLIYGLIFIGVLVLVEGIYLTLFGRSISLNSRVNRRLDMIQKGNKRADVMDKLRKEMNQHKRSMGIPLYSLLASKAQKAALAFSPIQLILLMGVVSVIAFFGLTVGTDSPLPVRVGHPFASAVQIISKEIKAPLASEFSISADECAYGRDVGDALKDLVERIGLQDLRFLAVAVTIQQQSGGNLAEILAGLAQVIRARFRRVKAMTAEAQWSGKFLSSFPLVALVVINVSKPDYYDEVMDHPYFIPACIFVAVFLTLNLIVMRVLTDIKV